MYMYRYMYMYMYMETRRENEIGKNETYERSATIGNISCNKGFFSQ